MTNISFLPSTPTRTWLCIDCGRRIEGYPGQGDVECDCGAPYNAFGQRLRDDWANNSSNYDDEIGDLEGFEISQLAAEIEELPRQPKKQSLNQLVYNSYAQYWYDVVDVAECAIAIKTYRKLGLLPWLDDYTTDDVFDKIQHLRNG